MTQAALLQIQVILLLALLVGATAIDLASHRIPNVLTGGGIVLGIALQVVTAGAPGLLLAVSGMLVGGLLLLPFYALNAMGAGDVKLMALAGTFLGPFPALIATGVTLVAGGFIAVALLIFKRGGRELIGRYRTMFAHAAVTREFVYRSPDRDAAAASRFPYAAAIAAGSIATLAYTSRLDFMAVLA